MVQTDNLDELLEGKRPITTNDVLHFDEFDVKYLQEHIAHNPHPGSLFMREVLTRINRWGFKFSRLLYSRNTVDPCVVLDTRVLTVLAWICLDTASILAMISTIQSITILCGCVSLACSGALIWLATHEPDRLELVCKNIAYRRVHIRQDSIRLDSTRQIVYYEDLRSVTLAGRTMTLVTPIYTFEIRFLPGEQNIDSIYKYILVRSGLSEQQDRCGDADKAKLV